MVRWLNNCPSYFFQLPIIYSTFGRSCQYQHVSPRRSCVFLLLNWLDVLTMIRRLVKSSKLFARVYRRYRTYKKRAAFSGMTNEQVFTKIYLDNTWHNGPEQKEYYYSGTGSYGAPADSYIAMINQFIKEHGVKSVTDFGCGDFAIGSEIAVANPSVFIHACDVVQQVIDANTKKYQLQNVNFHHLDASRSEVPKADLLTIRQVLQHLNNNDIQLILQKAGTYKYVIITEHLLKEGSETSFNKNKPSGPDIRLVENSGVYIDKPPFNMACKEILRCRDDAYNKEAYIVSYLIENDV